MHSATLPREEYYFYNLQPDSRKNLNARRWPGLLLNGTAGTGIFDNYSRQVEENVYVWLSMRSENSQIIVIVSSVSKSTINVILMLR